MYLLAQCCIFFKGNKAIMRLLLWSHVFPISGIWPKVKILYLIGVRKFFIFFFSLPYLYLFFFIEFMTKCCNPSSKNILFFFDCLLFLLLTLVIIIASYEKSHVWSLASTDIILGNKKKVRLCICMKFNINVVKTISMKKYFLRHNFLPKFFKLAKFNFSKFKM